nr:MAG TPA: hypothetical protein [Caudoviricetes sp.]DAL75395.1 MAG TPA: hypothetical protein [Bacteriophage sp.]
MPFNILSGSSHAPGLFSYHKIIIYQIFQKIFSTLKNDNRLIVVN